MPSAAGRCCGRVSQRVAHCSLPGPSAADARSVKPPHPAAPGQKSWCLATGSSARSPGSDRSVHRASWCAEALGDRTVVHNYGHGGGGISLCWGSSELAVELASATGQRRFAVLGCGVMGLTTARLLQDRGFEATIYAKDLPPATTSNIAGGQWSPYTVSDADKTTSAYRAQFERASRLSHRYFQELVGQGYGVRWIENYVLSAEPFRTQQDNPIGDLYFAPSVLPAGSHPFAAPHVRRFTTMLIEPSI